MAKTGPYGRDGNGRSVLNNCLRLIVDDLAGSELGFELLNDLRMHLLIDLDLEPTGGVSTIGQECLSASISWYPIWAVALRRLPKEITVRA